MILAVHRVQGQELTNLANVNAVAFRGSEQGFKQLLNALEGFGVVLTEKEKAAKEQAQNQAFMETLISVLPVKAAENG